MKFEEFKKEFEHIMNMTSQKIYSEESYPIVELCYTYINSQNELKPNKTTVKEINIKTNAYGVLP
jgi:hypothetical protein